MAPSFFGDCGGGIFEAVESQSYQIMSKINTLLPRAAEIRDAMTEGENTAERVGQMFVEIIEAADEISNAAESAQNAVAGVKLSSFTKEVVEDDNGGKHLRLKVTQADGTYKTVDLNPATDSTPGLLSGSMHAQFWTDHQTLGGHSAQIASLATELAQLRVAVTGSGSIAVGASPAYPLTLTVADGAGRFDGGGTSLQVDQYMDNIELSGACRLTIDNKYNIQKLAAQTAGLLDGFDIGQLRHSSLLSYLYLYGGCARGWLSDLPVSPLKQLRIQGCADVHGSVSSLGGYTQAQIISLPACSVSGDVSALAGCAALKALDLHATQVSGELTDLLDALAGNHAVGSEITVDLRNTQATYQSAGITEVMKFKFTSQVAVPGWVCISAAESGEIVVDTTETPVIDIQVPAAGDDSPQIGAAYRMTKPTEEEAQQI